tara:strand:- start:1684 stop:2169 length:486 start_codon:yes stop_codon:yes gene_type:complete
MSQKYKVYVNNKAKIITDNWNNLISEYKVIEAAGGLVLNTDKNILMIFRNDKWDLPKGKLEIDESIEHCATREVTEECGITGLQIQNKISVTYHTYIHNKEKILKKTHWFLMTSQSNNSLTPQLKEGITKVKWCNEELVYQNLKNSYGIIIDVINLYKTSI